MRIFRRWPEGVGGLRNAWLVLVGFGAFQQPSLTAAEIGRGPLYSVIEIAFHGPPQTAKDVPARDVDFHVRFRHESGSPAYHIHGFWDGDGQSGSAGDFFKIRFCPTRPGRWEMSEVSSNRKELAGQHQGDYVVALPSALHGFWEIDDASPGRRWYRRSDGSHQYIFGNTHYSFLSGYRWGSAPSGNDIAADIQANARYFKKLRFGLQGDHYPHPTEKPFLDDEGQPVDNGDYSHRPNPGWFHKRVDRAVQTAFAADLIADLILAGPDTENARATLRAQHNRGDAAPFLRYIAARYGSYPNVWLCLSNEYDIRKPVWTEDQIAGLGQTLRGFLPYPTPVSVHPSSRRPAWSAKFDGLPAWNDHQIIQRKLRGLGPAADVTRQTWQGVPGRSPRRKPTINDELSYQGDGDKHGEGDTIESHLGTFLGGGYASTGHKTGNKTGQYFPGNFDPAEHTAAVSLQWLRERIDANLTFWKMAPDADMFSDLDAGFRALAWPDHEYALGTNTAKKGLTVKLPPGTWTIARYDAIRRHETTLSSQAKGRFRFDAPDSRAVLFHFKKNSD